MSTPAAATRNRVFVTLSLSVVASGSAAVGLSALVRGLSLSTLLPFALGGAVAGWFLSAVPAYRKLRIFLGMLLGIILAFGVIGRLGNQLTAILIPLPRIGRNLFLSDPIDWTPLLEELRILQESIFVLGNRLASWLHLVARGSPAYDPIAVALLWTIGLWTAALAAGWWIRGKRSPLLAFGPLLLLLTYALASTNGNPNLVLPALGCLIAWMVLASHEAARDSQGLLPLRIEPTLEAGVQRSAVLLAAGLIATAALLPTLSLDGIRDRLSVWTAALTDGASTSLALGLQREAEPASLNPLSELRTGGLPVSHLVGSPPELEKQIVLEFRVQSEPHQGPSPEPEQLYWRVVSYDRYNGRGWSTSATERQSYQAGELLRSAADPRKLRLLSNVRVQPEAEGLLYHPGELVSVDEVYQVAWRSSEAPFGRPDAFGSTLETPSYQVVTLISLFGTEDLQEAGRMYPTGMLERYTTLPEAVPDRVIELAIELTATLPTVYDRARAIETYLRGFPYSLDVPALPLGVEVSDYFLFDLQRGYCDYYATTMVMLARAAGLPARLVVGYIGGRYDEASDLYLVTEDRAHSWVEIFFPGYGWIEFEPTAGRPALQRPRQAATLPLPVPPASSLPPAAPTARWLSALLLGGAGSLMVAGVGWLAWIEWDKWQLRRKAPEDVVRALFKRLLRVARWLEVPVESSDSPDEITKKMSACLEAGMPERRLNRQDGSLLEELTALGRTYARLRYGPPTPGLLDSRQLRRTWPAIRWRFLLLLLRYQLSSRIRLRAWLRARM